ncbi:MAG: CAP domain-containing protein [bacterium]|nr:CAP domain-containing protein [bacterium]
MALRKTRDISSLLAPIALAIFFIITLCAPLYGAAQTINSPLRTSEFIALVNADRAGNGAKPVAEDALLNLAAQKKADDMAARGYFSHTAPDGSQPWKWFTSAGYYYTSAGENLAMDFNSADSIERAWMNSPSHRKNLLNTKYTKMGIGIAQGIYNGKSTTFVVQFFAAPAPTVAKKNVPSKKVVTSRPKAKAPIAATGKP